MRVALFLPPSKKAYGGIEQSFYRLCCGMVERAIDTQLVLPDVVPELPSAPNGLKVKVLSASRLRYCILPIVRYLRETKPDIVIAPETIWCVIVVIAHIFARSGSLIICSIRTKPSVEIKQKLSHRFIFSLARYLFPRYVAQIHSVSKGAGEDFLKTLGPQPRKVVTIYNPIVNDDFYRGAEEPVEHPWLQTDQPPVIVGVGRLEPEKDFPTLLRAFAIARQKRQMRLVILGEGNDRPILEGLARKLGIQDDVDMPGFVHNPQRFVKRASLFVLSSVYEGFGNVVAEALAVGTPVVSTDCEGGPREVLRDGELGILVPVGDSDALAWEILAALEKNHDPEKLVQGVVDRFDSYSNVGQYIALFEKLLSMPLVSLESMKLSEEA